MASPLTNARKLFGESETLVKQVLKTLDWVSSVEAKTYTDRAVWKRDHVQFTTGMKNQPYVCGLDAPGVLTAGGIVLLFDLVDGGFIAFTVELKDTRAVVRMSVAATEYDESFMLLEEDMERQVRKWAAGVA